MITRRERILRLLRKQRRSVTLSGTVLQRVQQLAALLAPRITSQGTLPDGRFFIKGKAKTLRGDKVVEVINFTRIAVLRDFATLNWYDIV